MISRQGPFWFTVAEGTSTLPSRCLSPFLWAPPPSCISPVVVAVAVFAVPAEAAASPLGAGLRAGCAGKFTRLRVALRGDRKVRRCGNPIPLTLRENSPQSRRPQLPLGLFLAFVCFWPSALHGFLVLLPKQLILKYLCSALNWWFLKRNFKNHMHILIY